MSEPEFNGESECEPEGEGGLSAPEDVLRLDGVEWTDVDADVLVDVAQLSQRLLSVCRRCSSRLLLSCVSAVVVSGRPLTRLGSR